MEQAGARGRSRHFRVNPEKRKLGRIQTTILRSITPAVTRTEERYRLRHIIASTPRSDWRVAKLELRTAIAVAIAIEQASVREAPAIPPGSRSRSRQSALLISFEPSLIVPYSACRCWMK